MERRCGCTYIRWGHKEGEGRGTHNRKEVRETGRGPYIGSSSHLPSQSRAGLCPLTPFEVEKTTDRHAACPKNSPRKRRALYRSLMGDGPTGLCDEYFITSFHINKYKCLIWESMVYIFTLNSSAKAIGHARGVMTALSITFTTWWRLGNE